MKQPIIHYRTGNLHFTNWLANCETACANYTVFLRFRNESVNPVPGNDNRVFSIGQMANQVAASSPSFDLFANGMIKGYNFKDDQQPEIKIDADNIVAGWNRISWKSDAGSKWAKMDWHKFTLLPPPPRGMLIYIR